LSDCNTVRQVWPLHLPNVKESNKDLCFDFVVVIVCEHSWNLGKVTFQCAKILKAVGKILLTFVRSEPPSVRGREVSAYQGQLRMRMDVTASGSTSATERNGARTD
jgi:hypothetical protein